jgi:ferredoxin-NADP reductase
VAERGATPQVSNVRRRVLSVLRSFTSPLLPDDYLELVNPLWSTRELRGRIERIERETDDAVTVVIRPGFDWEGHKPGQYLRLGVDIDGRRHWRAYSLTSDPGREDGWISVTPKLYADGVVSPWINQEAKPGTLVRLGHVEGQFVLPDPIPPKMLFVSAGSGITPVMSMLRAAARAGGLKDTVHIHSSRTKDDVIFGDELRELHDEHNGFVLHERHTKKDGRLSPDQLDELCPDWKDREAFLCGPAEMLDAFVERWEQEGLEDKVHMERFQPRIGGGEAEGEGGHVKLLKSDIEFECDGATPILEAGEEAGAELDYGCRMGICHTCTGKLASGQLRDLRSGEVHGSEGEVVRICIAAPEGDVELEL